jgi:hypothetical protein
VPVGGVGPDGALVDPAADGLDLLARERLGLARHALVGVGLLEEPDEAAGGGVAREDDVSGGAAFERGGLAVEPEIPFGRIADVARVAEGLEDGLDVAGEVDLRGSEDERERPTEHEPSAATSRSQGEGGWPAPSERKRF